MALVLCSSLPTVIADREAPAESKALIKITHYYSPCSYPMLFSCQKSFRLEGVPPGWAKAVVGCQLSVARRIPSDTRVLIGRTSCRWAQLLCPKFGVKRRAPVSVTELNGVA